MPTAHRRLKPALVVACLVVAAGGLILVTHPFDIGHSQPNALPSPPASPSPQPAAGSPSPSGTATVAPTRSAPASHSPAATPRSPSPTPRATAASPSAAPSPTVVAGLTLVAGPYGFDVPQGWIFSPLLPTSATSQAAHWTDPASPARIDYLVSTSTGVYSVDHSLDLGAVEAALPCQKLPPLTFAEVPTRGPRYSCAPQGGLDVNGQVLVKPYPEGFRLLQVATAAPQDPAAAEMLTGFH